MSRSEEANLIPSPRQKPAWTAAHCIGALAICLIVLVAVVTCAAPRSTTRPPDGTETLLPPDNAEALLPPRNVSEKASRTFEAPFEDAAAPAIGRSGAPPPEPTPARTAAPTLDSMRPPCAEKGASCAEVRCCEAAGEQCYQKNSTFAACKPECRPGPDMAEPGYAIWTCKKFGERAPGKPEISDWTEHPVPDWAELNCSAYMRSCAATMCCAERGMQCYAKNRWHAACKPSCRRGPDLRDVDAEHWSCEEIGPRTPGKAADIDDSSLLVPGWVATKCSVGGENCNATLCCSEAGHRCFAKDAFWSSCKPECIPGPQPEDRADQNWTCTAAGPRTPGEAKAVHIRRGSFLALGDWGWDEESHHKSLRSRKCQKAIAQAMDEKMSEVGDIQFIINVGDSFYPDGVASKDDPQWDQKWRWVYSRQLRSVPWYSVYGNHDYHEESCVCNADEQNCAQVNFDEDDLEHFAMPGMSYFKERPDLGIEIVGLDLNLFHSGQDRRYDLHPERLFFIDCAFRSCLGECMHNVQNRTEVALNLFFDRIKHSTAKTMVVFSHYPTDYFGAAPEFLHKLRDNSQRSVVYFGGHRHSTDNVSTYSIKPNQNWLVGGGGGYGCDTQSQGFVVGEIWGDSSITTHSVLVPDCCG